MYSYFVDFETGRLENWDKIIPPFRYDPEVPFFEILVPTIDTVRFGFLMETLLEVRYSVLFTGFTGVGKVIKFQFVSQLRTYNYDVYKQYTLYMACAWLQVTFSLHDIAQCTVLL